MHLDNGEFLNLENRIYMKNEQREITVEQLAKMNKQDYVLVDVRSKEAYNHGYLSGAINIPSCDVSQNIDKLPKDKVIILYCMQGIISKDIADYLCEQGFDAYNLSGGYGEWLIGNFDEVPDYKAIEFSIMKKFRKNIFSKFAKAINVYNLVKEGDKIAVCISGGKDSMLMAKLFQELKRHDKFPFELVFLVMDPGYNETNRKVIENNARILNVPIEVFETKIFDSVYNIKKSPCYICARMRRGHLYNKAKELGCNKIALGHHFDDVIETILMGMLYGAQVQTMMPKLNSTNFDGMELIRPMYLIREDDIKHWRDYNKLHFIQCACRFTDTCTTCREDGSTQSKRMEIKNLIKELKKTNPYVEDNIFRSVENVNLSTVISYKKGNEAESIIEGYKIK